MEQRSLLYDARFLESYAGAIVTDPATAIVELVANCWDAYATQVEIAWPAADSGRQFRMRPARKRRRARARLSRHLHAAKAKPVHRLGSSLGFGLGKTACQAEQLDAADPWR